MSSPRKSRTAGETQNKKHKDSKGLKPVKNNGMLLAHYGLELDTSGGEQEAQMRKLSHIFPDMKVPTSVSQSMKHNNNWKPALKERPSTVGGPLRPIAEGVLPFTAFKEARPNLKPFPLRDVQTAPEGGSREDRARTKIVKLPDVCPSPQIMKIEKSMPKHLQARLQVLRKDPEQKGELERQVENWTLQRHGEKETEVTRDFHKEFLEELDYRFTPMHQGMELRARFKEQVKREKGVRQRKVDMAEEVLRNKREALVEKWSRWEEGRKQAQAREAIEARNRLVKAMMIIVTHSSRMQVINKRLHEVRRFQKQMVKLSNAVTFIQVYWRLNFLPRKQKKLLHTVNTIQAMTRFFLKRKRKNERASATKLLLIYLQDVSEASKVKETLAIFVSRLKCLQRGMHLCLLRLKYRRVALLAQWEKWESDVLKGEGVVSGRGKSKEKEKEKPKEKEPLEKKGQEKKVPSKDEQKSSKQETPKEEEKETKTKGDKDKKKGKGGDKDKDKKGASGVAAKAAKNVKTFHKVCNAAKLRVLDEKMEELRQVYFEEQLQWKADMADFEMEWKVRRFHLHAELVLNNESKKLTEAQIERKINLLKDEECPREPRWEYQATTEQLEEWHALALLLEAESPSIKDANNPLNATSLPSRAKRMGSGLLPGRSLGSTPLKAGKGPVKAEGTFTQLEEVDQEPS
mmetsp:Transcript_96/g.173  ORF Transcript_96/g.173 Transcript_96/m.173 type:complete len:687 (+) Transcript_96:221-2281(+)|eukprot:CAMPEP_0198197156 /NCGR_PEP_ID=MMETSP1445-20131203/742_1 /TAXON_ID=36898 /ORGANISM="Pyramimonas sp., Strain CCMP2087" /LENGTH=686 /DNA_ID=CAMNT_0043866337 /DNA_START=198 /DNA_END=2258 /DNA_ORIENTATION=+